LSQALNWPNFPLDVGSVMKKLIFVLALLGFAFPAKAQFTLFGDNNAPLYSSKASATKDGFAFPATSSKTTIIVIRPDIFVGEQSTGGLDQLNANWTENAREYLTKETGQFLSARGFSVTNLEKLEGEGEKLLTEYNALFKLVSNAAIRNDLFPAKGLPTKKGKFNWSLGSGISKIGELGDGGEYALFMFSRDSYGLAGRRALEIIGFARGVEAISKPQIGYSGLVDLKTGDLVWLNVNVRLSDDVRKPDGARKRVEKLLAKFPERRGDNN